MGDMADWVNERDDEGDEPMSSSPCGCCPLDFDCVEHETDKAWLLRMGDEKKYWFPKSRCVLEEDEKKIWVPEWLAYEKGLI